METLSLLRGSDQLAENLGACYAASFFTLGWGFEVEDLRNDWTEEEVWEIFEQPLLDLIFEAASVHRRHHKPGEVQICRNLNIKKGGCPEDCAYCPQAARYHTGVSPEAMMSVETAVEMAREAKSRGVSRVCMGAAWRGLPKGKPMERVLELTRAIAAEGVEVCCSLGLLESQEQADALKEAGAFAYNHNLDSGAEHYKRIITTRTYEDRLDTHEKIRQAGISLCCGGIVGIGDAREDRVALLHTLATLPEHPDSVPINKLNRVEGTPLAKQPDFPTDELIRCIATARILMPRSIVRMTAGRHTLSNWEQALVFLAGANSIFSGGEHFTTPAPGYDDDETLFQLLGLKPKLQQEPQPTASGAHA